MTRDRFFLLFLGLAVAAGSAGAQSFPDKSRPVKIIVPSGTASTGDVMARAYARAIADVAGLNVVVENKAGAEGVIGVQAVKSSPPDGYTLMMTSNSTQVMNVHMLPNLPYDPVADFVPLVGAGSMQLVMYVAPNSPFKSAREFIAAARQSPGKYSYGGNVTVARLAGEMLEKQTGTKLLFVPFKSLTDVLTSVSTGEVDITFASLSSGSAFVKGGRLRTLAVTGNQRMKALPELPTMLEEGVPQYTVTSWLALYLPAHASPAVATAWRDILKRAGKTAPVIEVQNMFAMEPLDLSGEELTTLQRTESANLSRFVLPPGQKAQ